MELNDIEAQISCRLPDDYRCSYRIHNGQKLVIPGSVSVSPSPWRRSSFWHPACLCVSGWWAACPCLTTTAQRCCWMWRRRPEGSSRGKGWDAASRSPSASTLDSASTWHWNLQKDAACSRASTPALCVTSLSAQPLKTNCLKLSFKPKHLCVSGSDGSGSFSHQHVHHRSVHLSPVRETDIDGGGVSVTPQTFRWNYFIWLSKLPVCVQVLVS